VALSGFPTAAQQRIDVVAGQTATANFELELASANQTVVVSESAVTVQTQNADTSATYYNEQIQNMPNLGSDRRRHFGRRGGVQLVRSSNFDQPVNEIANPLFGSITRLVGPPTSILGSFVAGNDSPRFVEMKAVFRF
jgi:hypothetical protein